jgi:hypothetical protein
MSLNASFHPAALQARARAWRLFNHGALETGAKVPSAPQALASSNSKVSAVNAAAIAASAAAPAFSSNLHHGLQQSREQLAAQQPQPPQASEPAVEQGDGSEFWS